MSFFVNLQVALSKGEKMFLNRIVVIAALLLSINVFAKAEKISYENGKKIYMAKCVSCHGVDGQKMTPWKFNNKGYKRFEDIVTHSVFIHNDISRKTIPKVLQEYGLSENQFKIKLNHVDGFNIKYFLAEEFSYEDSTTNSLVYIILILIVLAILLKYWIKKKKQEKILKEKEKLLDEAKRNGFDSIESFEAAKRYKELEIKAKQAGFSDVESYQAAIKEQERVRFEKEAKQAGFSDVKSYRAHLDERKRKEKEEKREKEKKYKEERKQKSAQQRAEEEAEKPIITSVVLVQQTVEIRGMYRGKEKILNRISCSPKSVQGWSSDTFTIIDIQGKFYVVYKMVPNGSFGRKWSNVTFEESSRTMIL